MPNERPSKTIEEEITELENLRQETLARTKEDLKRQFYEYFQPIQENFFLQVQQLDEFISDQHELNFNNFTKNREELITAFQAQKEQIESWGSTPTPNMMGWPLHAVQGYFEFRQNELIAKSSALQKLNTDYQKELAAVEQFFNQTKMGLDSGYSSALQAFSQERQLAVTNLTQHFQGLGLDGFDLN